MRETSPLAKVIVPCPMCANGIDVEIVADDGVITDGKLIVKLGCRYDHECPP